MSARGRCAVALAAAALLAGCGQASVSPSAQDLTDTAAHPVVAPGQAGAVLGRVDAAIAAATKAGKPDLLGVRAIGPFRQVTEASLKVSAARKQTPPAPPTITLTRLLLPAQVGWPRWFATAGTSPTLSTPVIRVLRSPSARTPYALWAQLSLLPGAQVPDVARADVGAAPLAANASGLKIAPDLVLRSYADLLNRGSASLASPQFGKDLFRAQLESTLVTERSGLAGVATVTSAHRVSTAEPVLALRTVDGGALVIGALTQTYDVAVRSGGGSVQITDPTVAALAGRDRITKSAQRVATEVLAFRVPPQGSNDLVTVVAAERAVVEATGT